MKIIWVLALLCPAQEKPPGHPIDALLQRPSSKPGPPCDDAAFLRRVSLDLTGVLPEPDAVRAFLKSTRKDKRTAKIDELLTSPAAAEYFGHLWVQWLMGHDVDGGDLVALDLGGLIRWLKSAWEKDLPFDELLRALLTAQGPFTEHPAGSFVAKHIVPGEPPAALAARSARLFLGVDLRCAQCHDHPFEKISQEDFWGFAAFFRGWTRTRDGLSVDVPRLSPKREDLGELHTEPKFLDGRRPEEGEALPAALARLALSMEGDVAARAIVERLWKTFFGRSLKGRADLQRSLAEQFVRGKWSLRGFVRSIATSAAYQRSSEGDEAARSEYAAGPLKPMNSVQFMKVWNHAFQFDAYYKAVFEKDPSKAPFFRDPDLFWIGQTMAAKELLFPKGRDPEDALASGTDRLALKLMNNRDLQLLMVAKFQQTGQLGWVWKVMRKTEDPGRRVEELFLLMVNRFPTAAEKRGLVEHLKGTRNPFHACGDVFWVLFNSAEFMFIG